MRATDAAEVTVSESSIYFTHQCTSAPRLPFYSRRYERNQLMFNLCFVCSVDMRTIQYEAIVRKLAHYLVTLERESQIISDPDVSFLRIDSGTPSSSSEIPDDSSSWICSLFVFQMKPNLLDIICQVRHDLDVKRSASIKVTKSTTIYLKVSQTTSLPRGQPFQKFPGKCRGPSRLFRVTFLLHECLSKSSKGRANRR